MTDFTWTSADGRSFKLHELSDDHLLNIVRHLDRMRQLVVELGGVASTGDEIVTVERYDMTIDIMTAECERRGLRVPMTIEGGVVRADKDHRLGDGKA